MAATPFFQQVHTTKKFRFLTEKTDVAGNRYIYAKGLASLAAGDFVVVTAQGVTTRTVAASTGVVAVAMAAVTATTSFGWFMVFGRMTTANVATHALGAGKALFTNATTARATTTPLTEATIVGAFSDGDSVANVGPVFLNRPSAPGDIST